MTGAVGAPTLESAAPPAATWRECAGGCRSQKPWSQDLSLAGSSRVLVFVPECVAKGSRFILGAGEALFAGCCATVRNRPQPFV